MGLPNTETVVPGVVFEQTTAEKLAGLIYKLNLKRKTANDYDDFWPEAKQIATFIDDNFSDWLKRTLPNDDHPHYLIFVGPYVSFRCFTHPFPKEVTLLPLTSSQKKRFLDEFIREFPEFKGNAHIRVLIAESLKTFLKFLATIERPLEQ